MPAVLGSPWPIMGCMPTPIKLSPVRRSSMGRTSVYVRTYTPIIIAAKNGVGSTYENVGHGNAALAGPRKVHGSGSDERRDDL